MSESNHSAQSANGPIVSRHMHASNIQTDDVSKILLMTKRFMHSPQDARR